MTRLLVFLALLGLTACAAPERQRDTDTDDATRIEQMTREARETIDELHESAAEKLEPLIVDDPEGEARKQGEFTLPMERGTGGILSDRRRAEKRGLSNPYLLNAHKQNYFLPLSATSAFNGPVYDQFDTLPPSNSMAPVEVKFQLSFKTRINEKDLLFRGDSLNFGLTLRSWWQLYTPENSSPFRETNYAPEFFYLAPLLRASFDGLMAVGVGIEHESNGQVQGLSRSWNRVYASLLYEKDNFSLMLRPWLRIPEDKKDNPGDAKGDDNPDILDYMGHGELAFGWHQPRYDVLTTLRGNPATGKGSFQLEFTMPWFSRYHGYIQIFSGYGESLIDYNLFQNRIGVGIALSTLL